MHINDNKQYNTQVHIQITYWIRAIIRVDINEQWHKYTHIYKKYMIDKNCIEEISECILDTDYINDHTYTK